jgi:hypothetical protein
MKRLPIRYVQLGFHIIMLVVAILLAVALTAIHLKFSDLIIGDFEVDASSQILTPLANERFEQAKQAFDERRAGIGSPKNFKNPFTSAGIIEPTGPIGIE